jgi:hypothetical protein
MVLVTNKAVERGDVPNEAIIGNLQDLYNKFVKAKGSIPTDFYNKQKNDLLNQKNKK